MASIDEQILRTAKEIVVKFIETGRVSPTGFPDLFHSVFETVHHAVKKEMPTTPQEPVATGKKGGKPQK